MTVMENRRKAVAFLRSTELPQASCTLYNAETGGYCAKGAMGIAVGLDAAQVAPGMYDHLYNSIDEVLGLNGDMSFLIEEMNDTTGLTLREIGDDLARRWGIE